MTKFYLSSWPIEKNGTGDGYAILITAPGPLGKYVPVEAQGLKGAQAAFEEFKAKAVATGKPMAIGIGMDGRSRERKPPGFEKWSSSVMPTYINGDKL